MPANKKKSAVASSDALAKFQAKQKEQAIKQARNKNDNKLALIVSAVAILVAVLAQFAYFTAGPGYVAPKTAEPKATVSNSPLVPSPALAEGREWTGTSEVNGKPLEISIDGAAAPQAAANFITLANKGFYNGLSCHRITNGGFYVLQCGDPNGDGTGGPGYSWGPLEHTPVDNVYMKGVIAMARAGGDGNSNGSQFFIVYEDTTIPSDAAGGYSVFGKVTKGLENLKPIIDGGVSGGGTDGKPAVATKLGAISLK